MGDLNDSSIALAALALSAAVASAAGATGFTASKYPTATDFSSKGNDNLETEAGSVECTVHYALGALSGPAETATLTPTYTECQAFGFSSATVNMNGCDYVLYVGGTFDIECPAGKSIVISASTCEATIGTQAGLKGSGAPEWACAVSRTRLSSDRRVQRKRSGMGSRSLAIGAST